MGARKESMDKITIGDQEYTLEEAQALIDKGQTAKEMEEKYNTDFSSAWSAYGKSQNEKKELDQKLQDATAELEKLRSSMPKTEAPQKGLTREELEELGYVRKEDVDKSYVKKDEIDSIFDSKIQTEREAQKIVQKMDYLKETIDGEDGRPKFEPEKVLDYMSEHNTLDPEEAYNQMHKDAIEEWKQKQLDGKKPSGMGVVNNTGNPDKTPQEPSVVRDNLGPSIREALSESTMKK